MARFFDGFDRTSPVAHSVSVIKTIHLRLFMLRVVFRRVVCSDQSSLLSTHPTLSTFATSTVFWHMPSADDLQLYNHTDPLLCSSVLARFSSCVSELNDWMASNRLQLNPSKTEIIWLGTARLLHTVRWVNNASPERLSNLALKHATLESWWTMNSP